jgi:prepilin-type processing-associated H-X9-DG protein
MRTNLLAWVSLVLGVLAVPTCGATAPLAILLGYLALRRVNHSDGQLAGGRAARAGMILGVLGIAALFVGLFVVGLYHLRGQSEQTVCTNNLRRIGQAISLYHDAKAPPNFPPATVLVPELAPDRRLSWMVSILPYMETEPTLGPSTAKAPAAFHKGAALYERFDLKKGWEQDPNREAAGVSPSWFLCPAAASRPAPGEPVPTQYVGIGGLGADAPALPMGDPRVGFFGYDRVITRADVRRGQSETMMVTERDKPLGPWAAGGPATAAGVDPQKQPYVPRQFGGLHPHGANTLFVDGHVVFLSDGAAPRVWEDQSRINVDQ